MISDSTTPQHPANIAVKAPIKVKNDRQLGEYSKSGEHLITKKIPAVTFVAACINAETGVGPSIASGNQTCSPSWADLPNAPSSKKRQIKFNKLKFKPKIQNFDTAK